ncbi:hypothetical protein JAAARDRAFT_187906 [Jaapia argillacea MUCL 33604]|uniref:Uncharacterized protein n=1 Tax=Jaapia argillacea MUCL 33604 TaxID=933084 RepID=A0A067QM43_9AGAM|nr:hypothetical protein JAAARDRAFT_187906 [Jaapia argillacea MUCL 33604]
MQPLRSPRSLEVKASGNTGSSLGSRAGSNLLRPDSTHGAARRSDPQRGRPSLGSKPSTVFPPVSQPPFRNLDSTNPQKFFFAQPSDSLSSLQATSLPKYSHQTLDASSGSNTGMVLPALLVAEDIATKMSSYPRASSSSQARDSSPLAVDSNPPYPDRSSTRSAAGFFEEESESIVMRWAADLRKSKIELGEQRRHIAQLQSQLNSATNEKADLLQRLETVKATAKKGITSAAQRLDELQTVVGTLESQSRSSFASVSEIRSSLAELAESRKDMSDSLKRIEPLLDEGGNLMKRAETMDIVNQFQSQTTQSQHVIDLLRDRLEGLGCELAESQHRVVDLEGNWIKDREELRSSSKELAIMTLRASNLSDALNAQKDELRNALVNSAKGEGRLSSMEEQVHQLETLLQEKESEIEYGRTLRIEFSLLQAQVVLYETQLSTLKPLQDELQICKKSLHERDTRIGIAEISHAAEQNVASELKARLLVAEGEVISATQEVQRLRSELQQSNSLETSVAGQLEKMTSDNLALERRLCGLQTQLSDKSAQHESCLSEYAILFCVPRQSKCSIKMVQILQERFEDQSVTLRITKEANGDLQEQLTTAERTFARDLEANSGRLNGDIRVLQEQKSTTENSLAKSRCDLVDHEAMASARIAILELQVTKLQDDAQVRDRLHQEKLKAAEDLVSQLQHAPASETKILQARCDELTQHLQEAKQTISGLGTEAESLRHSLHRMQSDNDHHEMRANTLSVRYKTNDLTDSEKTFTSSLVQSTQLIYEEKLVAQGNELRMRDNTVKILQNRVSLLESTLARHLDTQAKARNDGATEGRSMIDLKEWMSSQLTSSPFSSSGPQAPDRDGPSTNDDLDSPSIRHRTPAPPVAVPGSALINNTKKITPIRPGQVVEPPVLNEPTTPRQFNQTAGPSKAALAHTMTPGKRTFRALSADGDDILDFDDIPLMNRPGTLGKRERGAHPPEEDRAESGRPSRRAKAAPRKSEKPVADPTAKAKTRRRR